MTARPDPRQFDMFAVLEPAPPAPPSPPARIEDGLAARIIAAGLEHNEWLLNNNRTMGGWGVAKDEAYPWNLPSRAMHFPIEFRGGNGKGDGWISLRHPELAQHPFVVRVGEMLGEPVPWREVDEFGRALEGQTEWYHAVDLMTEQRWQALLDTRRFTNDDCLARAVQLALSHAASYEGKGVKIGAISLASARAVMSAIGAAEPADRSVWALTRPRLRPSKCEDRNSKGKVTKTWWPLNLHLGDGVIEAWAMIHGLEDGWFKRGRDGFVVWAEAGLERHALASSAAA